MIKPEKDQKEVKNTHPFSFSELRVGIFLSYKILNLMGLIFFTPHSFFHIKDN